MALDRVKLLYWKLLGCKELGVIFIPCASSYCNLLFFQIVLGDKQLAGYQKKKYVCKLLFIFLLGHDIDFGHMESVNLLSSNKYTEKQIVSTTLTAFFLNVVTCYCCGLHIPD